MNNIKYFKDLLESIPDCREILLSMFLTENGVDLSHECGFLKNDIYRLCLEFQNFLMEKIEDYLD